MVYLHVSVNTVRMRRLRKTQHGTSSGTEHKYAEWLPKHLTEIEVPDWQLWAKSEHCL